MGVVLQDVGQALAREHLAPQIVGLDPARVGRVAGTVVPAAVEGQEPRRLALEVGAEEHLVLVQREVGHAAAELEQLLARVAILLVLPGRVLHRLLGEGVLQLEGEDRQAVDEEADIQRPLAFVAAVTKLPGDGEAVLLEAFRGLLVAGRGGAVEQLQVERAMLDAVAQHLDGAPLRDLALQPRQELAPRRPVLVQRQRFGGLGLGVAQERGKLGEINAILTVVVVIAAGAPADTAVGSARLYERACRWWIAGMPGERHTDQALEALLARIGRH